MYALASNNQNTFKRTQWNYLHIHQAQPLCFATRFSRVSIAGYVDALQGSSPCLWNSLPALQG